MIVKNAAGSSPSSGREFLVRVIRKGDRYGLDNCLVHDDARNWGPMIEFWDLTNANKPGLGGLGGFGPDGQFVSRYYARTLAEDYREGSARQGLCLHGGVPEWNVDAAAMTKVLELVRALATTASECA
jgi:hypothetical protein